VALPTLKIGSARVTVLNLGDFALGIYDIFGKRADLGRYFRPEVLLTPPFSPSNTILIESGGSTILVDPGDRERLASAYGPQPPNAPPVPPPLSAQLESAGVSPSEVGTVVVTHLHFDHFAGVTRSHGGRWVPSFPNATHIIPRRDWEMPDIAEARKKGDRDVADTLGVLEQSGLLTFHDGPKDMGDGISIIPFPGESPGHQIVAVESGGRRCYCVGDLYHMKEEVEHPELAAIWADGPALLRSRNSFAERAAKESALVAPGHMSPGRISLKGGAAVWSDE